MRSIYRNEFDKIHQCDDYFKWKICQLTCRITNRRKSLQDWRNPTFCPCRSVVIDRLVFLIKSKKRILDDICVYLDKPRRSTRHSNIEESDRDEDLTITEKLRRASPQNPANIPMLVVISFTPDAKGLQKKQIEIQRGLKWETIKVNRAKWNEAFLLFFFSYLLGFPVNAQYIVNEWLCIKTADNDQGFVPYLCCRPMLRRLLNRSVDPSSYKLFNFDNDLNGLSSRKAPIVSNSTPTTKKKVSIANQPLSSVNSSQKQKQIEQTSSSCAGDSGVSDCESSSNPQQTNRSLKQTGLIVQDVPSRKVIQTNPSLLSRPDLFHPIKSQLAISTNSAFTQIIKKTGRFEK